MVPESKSDMTLSQQLIHDWFQNSSHPIAFKDKKRLAEIFVESSIPSNTNPGKALQALLELNTGGFIDLSYQTWLEIQRGEF